MIRALLALLAGASPLMAQAAVPDSAGQIAGALLPLPEVLRARATVRGFDVAGKRVLLRQGTNNMVCTGDRPGDDVFDVRCYERQFQAVIDRRRELAGDGAMSDPNDRFDAELREGKVKLPDHPSAGYRMLGPISAWNPATRTWTEAIERWESVHFPYRTAEEIGLPTEPEGTRPYVMASGTWWAHVMIEHRP